MNPFKVGSEYCVNLVDEYGKEIKVEGLITSINALGNCIVNFIIQDKLTGSQYRISPGQLGIPPEAAIIEG